MAGKTLVLAGFDELWGECGRRPDNPKSSASAISPLSLISKSNENQAVFEGGSIMVCP